MEEAMRVVREQVFLVQGQAVGGDGAPAATVERRVVVAADEEVLQGFLADQADFRPVGWASLRDYEDAVAMIREALKGSGLPVTVAPAAARFHGGENERTIGE